MQKIHASGLFLGMPTFLFRNGSAIWTNKRFVIFKLDVLIFVATEQKLHVSSGKPISHAMIQFKCNTQILHLQKGEQNRHVTCLKRIHCGGTWWCCREMNKTIFPTSFCLRVGKHKRLTAGTESCRNTTIQRIFSGTF